MCDLLFSGPAAALERRGWIPAAQGGIPAGASGMAWPGRDLRGHPVPAAAVGAAASLGMCCPKFFPCQLRPRIKVSELIMKLGR